MRLLVNSQLRLGSMKVNQTMQQGKAYHHQVGLQACYIAGWLSLLQQTRTGCSFLAQNRSQSPQIPHVPEAQIGPLHKLPLWNLASKQWSMSSSDALYFLTNKQLYGWRTPCCIQSCMAPRKNFRKLSSSSWPATCQHGHFGTTRRIKKKRCHMCITHSRDWQIGLHFHCLSHCTPIWHSWIELSIPSLAFLFF